MANLLEYVGNVHIFLGAYRGNPIALYLRRDGKTCRISPKVYPWNDIVGEGETPNRAAADFEEKWKARGLSPEMYTGPHWEGGIKPEKPAPQKPASVAKASGADATQTSADAKPPDPRKAVAATTPATVTAPAESSNPGTDTTD